MLRFFKKTRRFVFAAIIIPRRSVDFISEEKIQLFDSKAEAIDFLEQNGLRGSEFLRDSPFWQTSSVRDGTEFIIKQWEIK